MKSKSCVKSTADFRKKSLASKTKRPSVTKRLSAFAKDLRRLIRSHYPDWTDFHGSDPGITLIQLFAFLVEDLFNRVNKIPERNETPQVMQAG